MAANSGGGVPGATAQPAQPFHFSIEIEPFLVLSEKSELYLTKENDVQRFHEVEKCLRKILPPLREKFHSLRCGQPVAVDENLVIEWSVISVREFENLKNAIETDLFERIICTCLKSNGIESALKIGEASVYSFALSVDWKVKKITREIKHHFEGTTETLSNPLSKSQKIAGQQRTAEQLEESSSGMPGEKVTGESTPAAAGYSPTVPTGASVRSPETSLQGSFQTGMDAGSRQRPSAGSQATPQTALVQRGGGQSSGTALSSGVTSNASLPDPWIWHSPSTAAFMHLNIDHFIRTLNAMQLGTYQQNIGCVPPARVTGESTPAAAGSYTTVPTGASVRSHETSLQGRFQTGVDAGSSHRLSTGSQTTSHTALAQSGGGQSSGSALSTGVATSVPNREQNIGCVPPARVTGESTPAAAGYSSTVPTGASVRSPETSLQGSSQTGVDPGSRQRFSAGSQTTSHTALAQSGGGQSSGSALSTGVATSVPKREQSVATFRVYISPNVCKKKHLESVVIVRKEGRQELFTKMKPAKDEKSVWEVKLPFSVPFSYHYAFSAAAHVLKRFWKMMFESNSTLYSERGIRSCDMPGEVYELFLDDSDQPHVERSGYCTHILSLMTLCDTKNTTEVFWKLHRCIAKIVETDKMTRDLMTELWQRIFNRKLYQTDFLLVSLIILECCRPSALKKVIGADSHLTDFFEKNAKCILDHYTEIPVELLDIHCKGLHELIDYLCKCCYGKSHCYLVCLYYCLKVPSTSEGNIEEQVTALENGTADGRLTSSSVVSTSLSSGDAERMFQMICEKLCALENQSHAARHLLLKICELFPSKLLIKEMSRLQVCLGDETFLDRLCARLDSGFQCSDESLQFADFIDMLTVGEKLCKNSPDVLGRARKLFISYVKNKSNSEENVDGASCINNLLNCSVLWNDVFLTELSSVLSKSHNKSIHAAFLSLMKSDLARQCPVEELLQSSSQWMSTALKYHCRNHDSVFGGSVEQSLPPPYQYLQAVLAVPLLCHSEIKQRLEDKVFEDYARKCSVLQLLKTVCACKVIADSEIEDTMIRHLSKQLEGDHGKTDYFHNVKEWIGTQRESTTLHVQERIQAKVVRLCIDLCIAEKTLGEEEMALAALSRSKFWLDLCHMSGSFVTDIKKHELFSTVMSSLHAVGEQILRKTVSCWLMEKMHKGNSEEFLSLLVCAGGYERIRSAFGECWSLLLAAKTEISDIQRALNLIPLRLQPNVSNFDQLKHKVEEMMSDLEIGKTWISETDRKSGIFWEPLRGLIDSYKPLLVLGQSDLFWFFTEKTLRHVDVVALNASAEQDSASDALLDIPWLWEEEPVEEELKIPKAVLSVFATKGIEQYGRAWRPLFQSSDVTLKEIKEILERESVNMEKEIEIAEKYHGNPLPEVSADALYMYAHHDEYQTKVRAATATLQALGYDIDKDTKFKEAVDSFYKLQNSKNKENIYLRNLAAAKRTLQPVQDMIEGNFMDVLTELSRARKLFEFLRTLAKEDLRNWIDAVEDHSEQYVQESTVSNLIEVRRYLHQVLQDDLSKMTVAGIFHILSKSLTELSELPQKINDCIRHLYGLKSLLQNTANRGEATKQIVKRAVRQRGAKFLFHMKMGRCECQLQCPADKKKPQPMKMEDVLDFRSRALLLLNTEGKSGTRAKGGDTELKKSEYSTFVDYVDGAMQITEMYQCLWKLAHPVYYPNIPHSDVKIDTNDLEEKLQSLKDIHDEWEEELKTCRSHYISLNFFFPDQLWKIFHFLKTGEAEKKVVGLLHFAGFGTSAVKIAQDVFRELQPIATKFEAFRQVGQALDRASEQVEFVPADFPSECSTCTDLSRLSDVVEQGQLFIAALDENSMQVIPTLLTLYRNTTGTLPLPHQVLFCREDTTWEEIQLLLLRCAGADTSKERSLFCLVHVEKLTNKLQFKLVEELVKFCREDFSYLAVICRGSIRHPFIDHFSEVVHHVQPMSVKALELCFQSLWPEVEVVTSELPGQGKTEVIRQMAHEEEHEYACLLVSGDLDLRTIVKNLMEQNLSSQHLIHIDLGSLSDPLQFDNLMFQMVILRCVSYGSELCLIPTNLVKIEVANSINNVLVNSLKATLHFRRINLCWNGFSNFKFSMEVCSSEQVVCHYLKAHGNGDAGKTDLLFSGESALKPLDPDECRRILQNQFRSATDLSFSAVHLFLSILADQLKKLSCSSFMSVACLAEMAGDDKVASIRTAFVGALVDVAEEFSSRSVQACRTDQAAAISLTAEGTSKEDFLRDQLMATEASATAMTSRVDSMIRWSDSNHLVIVFHNQDIQTLSALYRDLTLVPPHVRELFETQIKKKLPDFASIDQNQLQQIVQRVARFSPNPLPETELVRLNSSYALTPDNVLKMILITLRVKANIPVIIMGETGCGKTSLIRYLAAICGVEFKVMNVHAGTLDSDIVDFVWGAHTEGVKTLTKQIWVFLDEINTCKHMGLINEVLCHHQCLGRPLSPNLVLMAACNPYKLRNQTSIHTAGLESKVKVDEQSKLVYRVHPLPESMVDYVWDYGTLSSGAGNSDESAYIARMVSGVLEDKTDMLVDALVASQNFIREVEQNDFCVSLRDINRFCILFKWFVKSLAIKSKEETSSTDSQRKAVLLAFAHVYHCRLPSNEKRRQYRTELSQIFAKHGWADLTRGSKTERMHEEESDLNQKMYQTQGDILEVICEEQRDLLNRMEVPEGTARNTALQENVFVVLNCILNRMPVFLVGKPGCSKSLSLQLIKSNLRGKDSQNEYFQSLPQLYFVSYQGSESSTSEGILKVFEKARKYRDSNKEEDVLPVVILDEIGLAEVSRFNPLKVLHSLLEPGEQELPDVAVVGVSNWALDAAKMNRAIHLSRPDMDREELFQTGISISEACMEPTSNALSLRSQSTSRISPLDRTLLEAVANAYDEYSSKQIIPNFHGLRDYYSFVKHISRVLNSSRNWNVHALHEGLLRNFGGVPAGFAPLVSVFQLHLEKMKLPFDREFTQCDILQLVNQNLNDKLARHLLLITHGDVALSILEAHLKAKEQKRSYATILGSRFEEDLTDDYNYRIISRIILHMEQGVVLILRDLESIYGSLYDMLNQNYTIIGTKRNCRIALGPYSNTLCQVHEDFRCIVLIEEQKLNLSDPPFLNRFEKQRLILQDILSEDQKAFAKDVDYWLMMLSNVEKTSFRINDLLPVHGTDLVPSLVHHISATSSGKNREEGEGMEMCEDILLHMFSPEGVLRAGRSLLAKNAYAQMQYVQQRYFALPLHDGLSHYVQDLVSHTEGSVKSIIVTHSNPHTDIASCMRTVSESCQVERLGALKSEKQLSLRSEQFWTDPDKEWLIFQCSVTTDMANFLLLKTTLEKHSQQHLAETLGSRKKNLMIVLHLDRTEKSCMLEVINYLMGWHLAFLDDLKESECSLKDYLGKTALQLIQEKNDLAQFVKQQLFWAFTRISYANSERSIDNLREVMKAILQDEEILGYIINTILDWLEHNDKATETEWLMDVACNVAALQSCSTLSSALERELWRFMEHPLAAVVFQLEKANAWDSLRMDHLEEKKKNLWLQFARDRSIVDISQVEAPMGPECYQCHTPVLGLRHPFSRTLFNRIEGLKECALATKYSKLDEMDRDDFDPLPEGVVADVCSQYHSRICLRGGDMLGERYDQQRQNYLHDFAAIVLGPSGFAQTHSCLWIMQWLLMKYVGDLNPLSFADFVVKLHCSYWLQESLIQAEFELISTCFMVTKGSDDQSLQCISGLSDEFNPESRHSSEMCEPSESIREVSSSSHDASFASAQDRPDSATGLEHSEQGSLLADDDDRLRGIESLEESHDDLNIFLHPSSDPVAAPAEQYHLVPDDETTSKDEVPLSDHLVPVTKVQNVTESVNSLSGSDLDSMTFLDENEMVGANSDEVAFSAPRCGSGNAFFGVDPSLTLNEDLANIAFCRLIPSASLFTDGELTVQSWQHTVSMLLSLEKKISLASSKVSISPAVSQGLQVALDFASCLKNFLGNLHQQRDYLTELGQRLAEDGVLSRGVFDYLLQLFADPVFGETHAREALSHFFAAYVTSCLRVDDDSENVAAFCWSLDTLGEKNMMDHLRFFGPPIHCALLMEIEQCTEDIHKLFTSDDMVQNSSVLKKLSDCSQKANKGSFHIMCLCVDVVEHFFLSYMRFNIQDPAFLELLHDWAASIKSGVCSLKVLIAVALLRKSLVLVVDRIQTGKSLSTAEQSAVERIGKMLTSFSNEGTTPINPLQKYVIRLLLQGAGTKTLKRLGAHLNDCSFLDVVPLDDASCLTSLDFQLQMSEHRTARISGAVLNTRRRARMQQVLRDAGGDGNTAYSVLAMASEHFYLVKSIRPLSDSETSQISALSESCRNMSLPENLSLFTDFLSSEGSVKHLVLTETVGEEGFQLAAFIIHLACKVVAFNLTTACPDSAASFWVQCLQSPETLSNCFLPAAPDTADGFKPLGFLPCMSTAGQVTFAKCRCGARTATTASNSEKLKCLSCKDLSMATDRWDKRSSVSSEPIAKKDFLKGFFFPDLDKLKDSALAVRQLSPCAFRVLQLMIHGCLLGSVAMNFITRENLQRLLRLSGDVDVTDVLYKHLETHWEVLASLTSLGHAQLGRLLHLIIDRCLDTTTPKADELLELEARENVEAVWCREIDHQILHRFPFLKDRIEKFIAEKAGGRITALENFTEETGSCSEECIALLFRETLRPSISNLKAEYSLQTQAQTTHPFIGLVLSKEMQLGLLCCLHPILSWHLLTVRMISYHMKKDETKRLEVHEYIHSFQEQDRKKMVQERFDAFKKAWNELCGHWEHLKTYHKTLRELEKISNQSRLDECLAMESSSVILQVLKALVEMHNEFLDDAVILSLRLDTPSLGFLKKNDTHSCIKGIPLELVSRKQLFELRLSDLPTSEMRFSQNCTQYGQGRKTEYNFFQYEMKWAEELLLDAPYLTMGLNFPQIVFSGELIQRSGTLLHDVHDILPQCDLDREMKKSVHALRERNPTNLRSLLESLEMVMSLLKKTSGQGSQDVDSASQYLDRWMHLLTPPPDAIMGFLKHVTLSQITGLFEFVEGLQAAMVWEALPDQYRSDLPAEARDSLDEAVSTSSLQGLELLLLALQKFALRYLSSPGTDLDCALWRCLQDPSLWPRSCLGDDNHCGAMDLVPPQLYMDHIHALIAYMDGAILNLKRQMEKSWIPDSASKGKKKTEQEEKQTKRRNVKRF